MRLLQVGLRSLLLYSLILVIISIPVSLFSIREILNEEVDESLKLNSGQFLKHIKNFEYLDDLETDLHVLDQLSYNIHIKPSAKGNTGSNFQTIMLYDSIEGDVRPFRQLSSSVVIKGKPYLLTIRMSLVDGQDLIVAIGIVQVALIILLTMGLILLNRSLSKKLWKPFYKTLNQLKAYEIDKNESIETEKTNIIEFDDLNKAIRSLTDRNRKVFLQQKEFIENASHELQTPLAVFQSKLDVLMQSPALSQSDAETLSELEATAQRMARLNKNLLLLSKIDNEQFTATEQIALDKLTQEILNNVKPMAEMNAIIITSLIEPLTLVANKALIEVLITNLLHNAVRHSPANGKIQVHISGKKLEVSNIGEPVKMEPDKMFERFSKETANTSSTGLGLAIVKKICDTCQYHLQYNYQNGMHVFCITFQGLTAGL